MLNARSKPHSCIEYLQVSRLTLFKDLGWKSAPSYSFLLHVKYARQVDKSQEDSSIVSGDLIHVYQNLILPIHISMSIKTVNNYSARKRASEKFHWKSSFQPGVQINWSFQVLLLYVACSKLQYLFHVLYVSNFNQITFHQNIVQFIRQMGGVRITSQKLGFPNPNCQSSPPFPLYISFLSVVAYTVSTDFYPGQLLTTLIKCVVTGALRQKKKQTGIFKWINIVSSILLTGIITLLHPQYE